jgi:hypothetical protein
MPSTYSPSLRVELITSGDQAGQWGNTTNENFAYIFDSAIAGYQTVSVIAANQALTYTDGPVSTPALNQSIYATLRLTTTTGAAFNVYAPPVSKQYIIWNDSAYTATIYNSTVIGNTTAAGAGTSVVRGVAYSVASLGSTTLGQWQALFSSLAAIPTVGQSIVATATGTLAGGATVTATVVIASGDKAVVFSDGTNFYDVKASSITGTLPIANGGTGQTTQQAAINALVGTQVANRVLRSDGTNSTLGQVALATDVSGTLPVANGGTGLSTYAANGVLYASGAGTLANSSGFVFDGTNVGVGASTPSTYGKFVVEGTGDFTSAFVSTAPGVFEQAKIELRKTRNVFSGQTNQVGRVSFKGKWGTSTEGEQAYINVTCQNVGDFADNTIMKLASVSLLGGTSTDTSTISLGYFGSAYVSQSHNFTGATTFNNAVTLTGGLASALPVASGGTGQTSYTDGQLLIGNTTGSTLTKATLTAGTGVTITNGNGSITISSAAAGTVTGVTGTPPIASSGGTAPIISLTTVPVNLGGTGLTTYTANGVLYASGTGTLANGSSLVFTGTNLGVGTNAPAAILSVTKTSTFVEAGLILRNANNTTGAGIGIEFETGTGTSGTTSSRIAQIQAVRRGSGPAGALDFYTRSLGGFTANPNMRLSDTGDLGLGAINPQAKLHVAADNTDSVGRFSTSFSTDMFLRFGNTTDSNGYLAYQGAAMTFGVANAEKGRIDASGNLQMLTGAVMQYQPAHVSITSAVTLSNADIQARILITSGTTYTITMPSGSTLNTLVPWAADNIGYDFCIINNASGTIALDANVGITILGSIFILAGVSAQFRIRRSAAGVYTVYRLS